jgi:hypothetical protein
MPKEADFVTEVTTSVGTGTVVLEGAVAGHRTFSTALAGLGSTVAVPYAIYDPTTGQREAGIGSFLAGSNALQRDFVQASTTGGKVSFAAGSKVVSIVDLAESTLVSRIRRPSDIGLEIIPAAGQTAEMLVIRKTDGTVAFSVDKDGTITGPDLGLGSSGTHVSDGKWEISSGGWLTCRKNRLVLPRIAEHVCRATWTLPGGPMANDDFVAFGIMRPPSDSGAAGTSSFSPGPGVTSIGAIEPAAKTTTTVTFSIVRQANQPDFPIGYFMYLDVWAQGDAP